MTVLLLHMDIGVMRTEDVLCRNAVSPMQNNCTWREKSRRSHWSTIFQQ